MKYKDEEDLPVNNHVTHKKKHKSKKSRVTANVVNCKYDLVKNNIEACGITILREDSASLASAYLVWYDTVVQIERFQALKDYQRINHFPSMGEVCRKDLLARNMAKMKRACPNHYNFTPKTWNMPSEYNLLQLYARENKKNNKKAFTCIQKPANGAMGNGIHLFRNVEKISPTEHTIVQEYLDRPLLLDGYKFDLRLYVLVTCCDPLKVFLYQDGLVRLSTEKYASPSESNVNQLFMHLTNYSVNKQNDKFERHKDVDQGSKRSVKSLLNKLKSAGYDSATLWHNITDLVIKTLIVAAPHLIHSYRMCRPGQSPYSESVCFEILGFDIFVDKKLKPWLLEVNRAPSFGGDERVDQEIKGGLIRDALRLINIRASDKRRNMQQERAEVQRRLFTPSHSRRTPSDGRTPLHRKYMIAQRKKELKEKLAWVRREAAREEYEDANLRGYARIFPCKDRVQREKYSTLLNDAFKLFQSQCPPYQRNEHYKPESEDMLLELIEQCETEEGITPKSAQPLSSMPVLTPPSSKSSSRQRKSYFSSSSSSSSDSEASDNGGVFNTVLQQQDQSKRAASKKSQRKREESVERGSPPKNKVHLPRQKKKVGRPSETNRTPIPHCVERSVSTPTTVYGRSPYKKIEGSDKSLSASMTTFTMSRQNNTSSRLSQRKSIYQRIDEQRNILKQANDWDLECSKKTLEALENTRIKFPGKSDAEAEMILDGIMKNWKHHKPMLANYWLVSLDSVKRRKVIDIVRGTVHVIMQRIWKKTNLESLRLMRLINRVFNRMLWSHGQGLWNCFTTSSNSWETIFSKSTDTVTPLELQCCRRVVRLCKDCLLVVYQFAHDVTNHAIKTNPSQTSCSARPQIQSKRYELQSSKCYPSLDLSEGASQAKDYYTTRFSKGLTTASNRPSMPRYLMLSPFQ